MFLQVTLAGEAEGRSAGRCGVLRDAGVTCAGSADQHDWLPSPMMRLLPSPIIPDGFRSEGKIKDIIGRCSRQCTFPALCVFLGVLAGAA